MTGNRIQYSLPSRAVLIAIAFMTTVAFAPTAAAPSHAASPGNPGIVLLTPGEARKLDLSDREWRSVPRARELSTGPLIVVRRPRLSGPTAVPTIDTTTPTNMVVLFQPRTAPVDMSSLEVEAHKGFFSKSLTALLRPYIHGNKLVLTNAQIPPGRFLLDISISDQSGDTTSQSYRLEVTRE